MKISRVFEGAGYLGKAKNLNNESDKLLIKKVDFNGKNCCRHIDGHYNNTGIRKPSYHASSDFRNRADIFNYISYNIA